MCQTLLLLRFVILILNVWQGELGTQRGALSCAGEALWCSVVQAAREESFRVQQVLTCSVEFAHTLTQCFSPAVEVLLEVFLYAHLQMLGIVNYSLLPYRGRAVN